MTPQQQNNAGASTRPPAAPWLPLKDSGRGYLSVYFSDKLARWPVRGITKIGDNKSDPNLETGTYGLFSTCEPTMRNRIIQDGAATIFFIATPKQNGGRVLSGYYHIGWFTEGTQGAINADFALAASTMRFIDPIHLDKLPEDLARISTVPFRQMMPLNPAATSQLRGIVDDKEDRTEEYVREIHRIERFVRDNNEDGFAYPSWGRIHSFSWSDADQYYRGEGELAKVPNGSRTDKWRCRHCDGLVVSKALLKRCPACKQTATLVPEPEPTA